MNPPRKSKLQHEQEQESEQTTQGQQTQQAPLEFATAEEAIRHDAAQSDLPPAIAKRLRDSIAREPKPAASWWKRLLRR
jgi:hypothetical protein